MSEFEQRLRQEMLDLAQRLAPGDPRPLRPPPCPPARQPRDSVRWLAPVAAMAAIVLLAGGLLAARNVLHARAAPDRPVASHLDPDVVAVTGMSASGADDSIKIISAGTGRVVTTVRFASDGNGLALAPDAKSLYVVGADLWIRQVSVTTGKSEPVAAGVYPAASPDSLTLAYASGQNFTDVAIRDLGTGHTRSISLLPLIGGDSSLLNQGGLTWLGNGTQLVAVPEPDPVPVTGGTTPGKPVRAGKSDTSIRPIASAPFAAGSQSVNRTACGQQTSRSGLCVIVVDVRARGLRAREVFVPHVVRAGPLDVLSADLTAKRSFVLALPGRKSDELDRVSLAGASATVRHLVTLPDEAFAIAVAPDADRVLYVPHGSPAAIWTATLARGHLTRAHPLLANSARFEFDQAAW